MSYKKEKVTFQAFDGTNINCLKLTPTLKGALRVPAVLFQPGNRMTPDDYLWLLEPLAREGWLVYGIYQRGHGSGVPDCNDRGGPIQQQDLQLALDLVKQDDLVDTERVALVGHSNGGHMIQRLAVQESVKCLVPMSQISDWYLFVSSSQDYLPDYYKAVTEEFGGGPEENPQPYWERSCLHLAEQIAIPVLTIVGGDDTTTPPHLSRLMHEALVKGGNQRAEMAVIPGVGHFYEVYAFDGYLTKKVAQIVVDWLKKIL